jgi:pyroglutamyl-peptidase
MSEKLRILITGFGPFPGAPFNPTMPLVERLTERRRAAIDAVELTGHIFHVTYQTVDRELPELIERLSPHAVLMFGLANRTAYLRIETRARNAVTTRLPDADGNRNQTGSIVAGAKAMPFGLHTASLLQAALATGIDARASRDAGSYLCNYLSWRAIEATQKPGGPALAAFVHVPLVKHDGTSHWGATGITLDQLVDAGEVMLMEMVTLAGQTARETVPALECSAGRREVKI